jgi:hypothetical protein
VTEEWGWGKPPPPSQKSGERGDTVKKLRRKVSEHERLLKDFGCGICKKVGAGPGGTEGKGAGAGVRRGGGVESGLG